MGGQQTRLLLCSAAAVALVVGSLCFLHPLEDASGAFMLSAGIVFAGFAVYFFMRPAPEEAEYKPIVVQRPRSPSQPQLRAKSPSQPDAHRPRTSSSGPIDLSARLPRVSVQVALRAPLPEPAPVPADQIPVAPESGLIIRKRPTSIPPTKPNLNRRGGAKAMSAQDLATLTVDDISKLLETNSAPPGTEVLPALRGKINYAVSRAALTIAGIDAQREDGVGLLIAWDSIKGIIARRLPPEAPFDGATFIDLVSTAGSTLRILPWTAVTGVPFNDGGEQRARALVKLFSARCIGVPLDPATRLFATSSGQAVQLPTPMLLATHDARFA